MFVCLNKSLINDKRYIYRKILYIRIFINIYYNITNKIYNKNSIYKKIYYHIIELYIIVKLCLKIINWGIYAFKYKE